MQVEVHSTCILGTDLLVARVPLNAVTLVWCYYTFLLKYNYGMFSAHAF